MVERLFLTVPWGCLWFVFVVFPDHTHLLFLIVFYLFFVFVFFFSYLFFFSFLLLFLSLSVVCPFLTILLIFSFVFDFNGLVSMIWHL